MQRWRKKKYKKGVKKEGESTMRGREEKEVENEGEMKENNATKEKRSGRRKQKKGDQESNSEKRVKQTLNLFARYACIDNSLSISNPFSALGQQ